MTKRGLYDIESITHYIISHYCTMPQEYLIQKRQAKLLVFKK